MNKSLRWKVAQSVELKWWNNYLKGKDKTAYLTWKKGYWNGLLDKIQTPLGLDQHSRILDAGCGPAGIFIILPDLPVVAVDPLLDKYAAQLDHFDPSDYPTVDFRNAPLEEFRDSQPYDVVFCMNAINHVDDLDKSFDLIVELTKPGGILVVTIDAHNYALFKHIFRAIPGDVLHPHQYDLEEYTSMLTDRGCTMLEEINLKKEFFFDHYMLVARREVGS